MGAQYNHFDKVILMGTFNIGFNLEMTKKYSVSLLSNMHLIFSLQADVRKLVDF